MSIDLQLVLSDAINQSSARSASKGIASEWTSIQTSAAHLFRRSFNPDRSHNNTLSKCILDSATLGYLPVLRKSTLLLQQEQVLMYLFVMPRILQGVMMAFEL